MLTLSPAVRVYVATGATDLRRSIDGLSAVVREHFGLDPLFCDGLRSVLWVYGALRSSQMLLD